MKEEAVQQLEEEFEFVDKELRQLQQRAEGRKRRELESLRRFGIISFWNTVFGPCMTNGYI